MDRLIRMQQNSFGTTASAASWGRVVGPLMAGGALYLGGYSLAWGATVMVAAWYCFWAILLVNKGGAR